MSLLVLILVLDDCKVLECLGKLAVMKDRREGRGEIRDEGRDLALSGVIFKNNGFMKVMGDGTQQSGFTTDTIPRIMVFLES